LLLNYFLVGLQHLLAVRDWQALEVKTAQVIRLEVVPVEEFVGLKILVLQLLGIQVQS